MKLAALILVGLLAIQCSSRLMIRAPSDLKKQFDMVNGINYISLTPADKIDVNKVLTGTVVLADPIQACEDLTKIASNTEDQDHKPIVIARIGECSYTHKAKMAELAGAQMLIIVSNKQKISNEYRDLALTSIHIEIVEISKPDGDLIINYLEEENKRDTRFRNPVEVTFTLEAEKTIIDKNKYGQNKVDVHFWYTSSDTTGDGYEFLNNIREVQNKLGHLMLFEPHYVMYQCETCEMTGFKYQDTDCLSGGRYCDPEPDTAPHRGSKVILEDLRQKCLHNQVNQEKDVVQAREHFWNYAEYFGRSCLTREDAKLEDCSREAYNAIGIPSEMIQKVEECMRSSFQPRARGNLEDSLDPNIILDQEYAMQKDYHVSHYPVMFVNHNRYMGSPKNGRAIFEFVCKHFATLPEPCREFGDITIQASSGYDGHVIFLVIVITVIIMIIMICFVRRSVKRKIMLQMHDEITNTIAQYRQIKDKSTLEGDMP